MRIRNSVPDFVPFERRFFTSQLNIGVVFGSCARAVYTVPILSLEAAIFADRGMRRQLDRINMSDWRWAVARRRSGWNQPERNKNR